MHPSDIDRFITACRLQLPVAISMTNQTPLPLGYSSGGPTPTPFQPMNTTPGSDEEQQSSGTATETQPAPTPTPYADLGFELPKSMINILLLGSDRRADNSFRTDVIMMLSLDPEKELHLSFPSRGIFTCPFQGWEWKGSTHRRNSVVSHSPRRHSS